VYNSGCVGQLVCNTLKKGGKGFHALFFVIFEISKKIVKKKILNNQVEGEVIK
jgi:hypothetical protein